MNQVPWNDDSREVEAVNRLSIFTYPSHLLGQFKKRRYLKEDEFYVTNYIY